MLPNPSKHNTSLEFFHGLCASIGRSQEWIAQNSGISRRRIQYLAAGYRLVNGEKRAALITYCEQFCLECLGEATKLADSHAAK